ncbi:bZIP transcription factor [Purpureocillium lilacinum]|uniref:BZIP transcription factor n=1 Tax=Purpureocillium lilacinum TaxID=33203 RepID=A0A179HE54_PURLI|nr:bZIP transcription factor [Purpureocillium lilacinum]
MDDHETQSVGSNANSNAMERSDSSASTSPSENNEPIIHQPVPTRPRLPSRKSSGPMVVPRDSSAVGPVEPHFGPDDVRAMSPRRTSEDIDKMGKEAREELRRQVDCYRSACRGRRAMLTAEGRHAKALQESLITIFNRIEAVREEHDKLDSNNKFLQKYIGDLMSTTKITASGSRGKK